MAERPNIVFILADQLRYDFLGCYGGKAIDTPSIDRLATEGIRYDNAMSASPICVPARTSLLTGMNPLQHGVVNNLQGIRLDYAELGEQTWPELLSEGPYTTAAVGKMHFYPWDAEFGFEHRVIAEDKRWLHVQDDYYRELESNGLRKLHGSEHAGYFEQKGAIISRIPWELSPDRFVGSQACKYIRDSGNGQPFALMVGFPGPHCPYDPVDSFLEKVNTEVLPDPVPSVPGMASTLHRMNIRHNAQDWNGIDYSDFTFEQKLTLRRHYAALVGQLDYEVGEILDTLEAQGALDTTAVILASDHGDYLGDHDMVGKGSFFEGAVRVPILVRPPGGISGGEVREELVELRDITATILRLSGTNRPDYMDAVPLPGTGFAGDAPRATLSGFLAEGWMHYDGRFKLHIYETDEVLLFDLVEDPCEQHNLSSSSLHQDVLVRLWHELAAEAMRSLRTLTHDRLAGEGDLSDDPDFGRAGWERPFPFPFRGASGNREDVSGPGDG